MGMEVQMALDKDVKKMSFSKRGEEIQRLRKLIRTHKSLKNNARCWLSDLALYDRALPEGSGGAGKMMLPKKTLLIQCASYIDRQQRDICPKSGT
jgi:hypothetical protein